VEKSVGFLSIGHLLFNLKSFLHSLIRLCGALGVIFAIWLLIVWFFETPNYLLPSPLRVAGVFVNQPVYLLSNALITVNEMVLGLLVGSSAGVAFALAMHLSRFLQRALMPMIVVTQTLPVFAIAPLLVIWFGFGMGSKIVMASLIIFFPVASSFYDGLQSVPRRYGDLAHVWRAGRWQSLWVLEIPASLPALATGLKVAATVAPIGAVVGEWAGAAGGLGFVMLQANARTQTEVVFASLILLGICAWILRALVVLAMDRLIWWARF